MIAIDHFKYENFNSQSFIRKNFSLKKERTENSCIKKINENLDINNYNPLFINKFNCHERGLPVFQLFSNFSVNITTINISRNYVKFFNTEFLPVAIEKLDISHNQIQELGALPQSIKYLKISENPIQRIENIPNNLKTLKASKCFLQELPSLPATLEILSVKKNRLKTLPNTILNCENLNDLKYENNPDIIVSNEILEFIDRLFFNQRNQGAENQYYRGYLNIQTQIPKLRNVYKDGQNVHDTVINSSTRDSIRKMIKSVGFTKQPHIKNTLKKFKERLKRIYGKEISYDIFNKFTQFCRLNYLVSEIEQTFGQIFYYIWKIIEKKDEETGDEICRIIYNEINEMHTVCFTGKIGRLVNSLSGFVEEVNIKININQQIQAKYAVVKKELEKEGLYKTNSLKYYKEFSERFKKLMDEIDIPEDIQNIWLDELKE